MWQVKVFVISTPVLADLKQLLESNVCRNKAIAELEITVLWLKPLLLVSPASW